jgi:photosystem II stability/assembly factor-like uncharacterized protein
MIWLIGFCLVYVAFLFNQLVTVQATSPTANPTFRPSSLPTTPSQWVQTSAPYGEWGNLAGSDTVQYMAASHSIPAGDKNQIILSNDTGINWRYAQLPSACNTTKTFYCGTCLSMSSNGQSIYGCVSASKLNFNQVLLSNDSGLTWSLSNQFAGSTPYEWKAIATSSSGEASVLMDSNYGLLYLSSDGGINWTYLRNLTTYVNPGCSDCFYDIACDGLCTQFIIASELALFGVSSSSPDTVITYYANAGYQFNQVAASADFMTFAAVSLSSYTSIQVSVNGGRSWFPAVAPADKWGWLTITMNTQGTVMGAIDGHSVVFMSWDNGTTFDEVSGPQDYNYGFVVSNNGEFAAVSGYSHIYTETFVPTEMPTSTPTLTYAPSAHPTVQPNPFPTPVPSQTPEANHQSSDLSKNVIVAGTVIGSVVAVGTLFFIGYLYFYTSNVVQSRLTTPLINVVNP